MFEKAMDALFTSAPCRPGESACGRKFASGTEGMQRERGKKFLLQFLAAALAVSLCGCGAAQEAPETSSVPASSASSSAPESVPEPEPDPKTTPEYHSTEAIQERGVLTVCPSSSSYLVYVIPDDPEVYGELAGTWAGYIPELCRRIAGELGVEAEFIEFDTLEEELQAAVNGDADLIAGNFIITEERLALYEMTERFDVWENQGDEIFLSTHPLPWPERDEEEADSVSAGASASEPDAEPEPREMIQSEEELGSARIGVLRGSAQVKSVSVLYPDAELHELDTNEAILEALIAGEVDAGVFSAFNRAFADEIMEAIVDGDVAQCGYTVPLADFRGNALILMKGNEDLCQTISAIIAELKESGWLAECYAAQKALATERGII